MEGVVESGAGVGQATPLPTDRFGGRGGALPLSVTVHCKLTVSKFWLERWDRATLPFATHVLCGSLGAEAA